MTDKAEPFHGMPQRDIFVGRLRSGREANKRRMAAAQEMTREELLALLEKALDDATWLGASSAAWSNAFVVEQGALRNLLTWHGDEAMRAGG